jgi:hypothetical protein
MSPQFLPHLIFLIAGAILACVALGRLGSRQWASALRLGGLGLLLMGAAIAGGRYVSWKESRTWRLPESMRPRPLLPENRSASAERPDEPDTMTLVLGGVRVRVPVSDHYDLSASDEIFLTVTTKGTGLLVSCSAAGAASPYSRSNLLAARISENTVTFKAPGIETRRPNPHTILVEEDGAETLRVHYPDPRTLEVSGQIQLSMGVVQVKDGIAWSGNFIPPGPLDLTAQGPGRIDFEPSGLIRVVPE